MEDDEEAWPEEDDEAWRAELKEVCKSMGRRIERKEPTLCKSNGETVGENEIDRAYMQLTSDLSKLVGIPVSYIRGEPLKRIVVDFLHLPRL